MGVSKGRMQLDFGKLVFLLHFLSYTESDYGKSLLISLFSLSLNVEETNDVMPVQALSTTINLVKNDYESLPSYIKGLASWEV